jgi:O-antigen/teichoic acid export membrane protein
MKIILMNWSQIKNTKLLSSALVKNSAWGIASNILQILFVCIFFAVVARKYNANEFARFLVSTSVYQIVAAFSSMGLGQWFVRQYVLEKDKITLTGKFLKTQLGLGMLFYVVNIAFAFLAYADPQIKLLCIILGTNIIFDNLINGIRSINIVEGKQHKTALILVIDGFLKLLNGCLLFIHPFSIVILSVITIITRLLTLHLFIRLGSSNNINLKSLWHAQISLDDLRVLIAKNWRFIVIGSISIIYWKMGNIIISKTLSLTDVADYEIAFRIFSVFLILPIVASSTIYPQFIRYYNAGNHTALIRLYRNIFFAYTLFALVSYAFMYSLSDSIIPLAFGKGYPGAILCTQQMFLTFLVLPSVLLQANLIVALGLEKLDMLFNIFCFCVNVAGCFAGLYFIKELSVVNYSVCFSFFVFHILQNTLLVRKKITTIKYCLVFYSVVFSTPFIYQHLAVNIHPVILFISFLIALVIIISASFLYKRSHYSLYLTVLKKTES